MIEPPRHPSFLISSLPDIIWLISRLFYTHFYLIYLYCHIIIIKRKRFRNCLCPAEKGMSSVVLCNKNLQSSSGLNNKSLFSLMLLVHHGSARGSARCDCSGLHAVGTTTILHISGLNTRRKRWF